MVDDFVLSIPDYTTNIEKQAYLDAMKIAGLNCLRVVHESTAIGICYGYEKA